MWKNHQLNDEKQSKEKDYLICSSNTLHSMSLKAFIRIFITGFYEMVYEFGDKFRFCDCYDTNIFKDISAIDSFARCTYK